MQLKGTVLACKALDSSPATKQKKLKRTNRSEGTKE
jgi:hypothetical protein